MKHKKYFSAKIFGVGSLCLGLAFAYNAQATDLFTVNADAGSIGTRTQTFHKIEDSINFMNVANLQSAFSGTSFNAYTTNYTVSGLYRGLNARFVTVGNTITMHIPAINFTKSFPGITRDDAVRQIKDWFKKDGGSSLDALFRKYAEQTPIDPIAGNPNSLQARTVTTAFDRGFTRLATSVASAESASSNDSEKTNANQMTAAFKYNSSFGDYKNSSYTLPLGYVWRFDDDVRHQLSFDLPLGYSDIEKGQVYNLGFGVGYSHPLAESWVMSAGVDYGATLSLDLGSGGHLLTSNLTSLYTYAFTSSMKVHMGNMFGYSTTLPMSAGDYSSDPKLDNYIFRNALLFYFGTPAIMKNTGVELFVIDTRYLGTKLYDDNYQEIGMSFGFDRPSYEGRRRSDRSLRIGVTGMIAKNNNGVTMNLGYAF